MTMKISVKLQFRFSMASVTHWNETEPILKFYWSFQGVIRANNRINTQNTAIIEFRRKNTRARPKNQGSDSSSVANPLTEERTGEAILVLVIIDMAKLNKALQCLFNGRRIVNPRPVPELILASSYLQLHQLA